MKRLAILGSTGSIGVTTLKVVRNLGSEFTVEALAAHSNIDLLQQQIEMVRPKVVAVFDEQRAEELRQRVSGLSVLSGMDGLLELVSLSDVDLVVAAIVGTAGILPTVTAIEAGKDIALANKEALVSAGQIVMEKAEQHGVSILPVDSEHSALLQCINGEQRGEIKRLILTASGGPFREYDVERLASVSVKDALAHPNWSMGKKVSVDSSTLMNKGLEVIEAHWLYNVPFEQIEVVIHPQSIVHSMVEFVDGSVMAQMGLPDMALPIQYALTYPNRSQGITPHLDFTQALNLNFSPPDTKRFPCLDLAYQAGKCGRSLPGYLNAANEVLVERFLNEQIKWSELAEKLSLLLQRHTAKKADTVEEVLAIDSQARKDARTI